MTTRSIEFSLRVAPAFSSPAACTCLRESVVLDITQIGNPVLREQCREVLEEELRTTRSQLEKRIASLSKGSDGEADVRRKLQKAKRRAAQARDEQKWSIPGEARTASSWLQMASPTVSVAAAR